VEAGTVKLVGNNKRGIISEVRGLLHNKFEYNKMVRARNPFGDGKAAEYISEIILKNFK
jgi:UDP-N-acetylglucosamine 2-epimerase (non-hydrolysing)